MMSHYISMARENYNKHIRGAIKIPYKRYLYAFRGVFYALWTRDVDSLPSMRIVDDMENYEISLEIKDIILSLKGEIIIKNN